MLLPRDGDIQSWVEEMRDWQRLQTDEFSRNKFYTNSDMIVGKPPIYRGYANPDKLYTADEYLRVKIATDGPCGVMLMQTGRKGGIKRLEDRVPAEVIPYGQENIMVNGQPVDRVGIFEYLSATFQEGPGQLAVNQGNWLPANRSSDDLVPYVQWSTTDACLQWGTTYTTGPSAGKQYRLGVA